MKQLTAICLFAVFFAACGSGKHEPVTKDSVATALGNSTVTGEGKGSADSTNGAVVTPIDTANANRRNPQ